MQIAHRSEAAPSRAERALERSMEAAFDLLDLQWASLERLLDGRSLSTQLAGQLFEADTVLTAFQVRTIWILAQRNERQWVLARAYRSLFYAPFRSYSGTAGSDHDGEDYVRQENDDREEHRELALADGTRVLVREIQPEDAPALQRLVDRLSEQTVYLRFFGPMRELSNKQARHFAEVDGKDRYALVALDPENADEIVAVVRYDREGDTNRAEYAALVEDHLQGRGLGFALTRALIGAARERGIRNFEAMVLPENRGMIHLLSSLDLPEHVRREEGVKHFSINLFPEEAYEAS